jgi:hypothetical protein
VLIVVVERPPARVVKLAPVTPNVPATVVAPVIEAPPVVTVSVLEIVAVPALLKLPDVTFRPFPAVSNPPTLKIPESDSLPTVRVPIYAEAVLIVVVDMPPEGLNAPVKTKFAIYAFVVLIDVVDRPPLAVNNPPTLKIPESDSLPTVRVPI